LQSAPGADNPRYADVSFSQKTQRTETNGRKLLHSLDLSKSKTQLAHCTASGTVCQSGYRNYFRCEQTT